ncbi:2-hydroxyacid dehydrogenase [Ilumatobacter nonamiensis]|uniref:2-hydroxyacid dehydrogenase n=1 Tax=Ilumatobacter nonamiensis TaxID=467093 RepID=UPI00034B54F7|nr:NAD(P)-dependent oxidoreductase [Ilumatobacter nonamiensis]
MILLLETVHDDALRVLEAAGPVELVEDLDAFDPAAYDGVRAIVTRGRGRVTAEVMAAFPELEVVARCGAGLDNVDTEAAAREGIAVVHAPGLTTNTVAEHALMLMLAVARRLTEVDAAVKGGNWGVRNGFIGTELNGKRLGIVGFGAIGGRIAEIGQALGMDVACTTRRTTGVAVPRVDFDELVATSDVIQICVPLTAATTSMFGTTEFARMKSTAILVNTARGAIVDQEALADALEAGELAGYGTDVWDPEPPFGGDRVLAHPGTVVTPHVAGLTDVTYRAICMLPCHAVASILAGDDPDPAAVFR